MPRSTESTLALLLRLLGLICMTAIVPAVMPRVWISATHSWLEFGNFPVAPIAEYLARSTSMLASMYGVLLWLLAVDVRRYVLVIQFLAGAMMVISICSIVIGINSELPPKWLVVDAAACWMFGVPILLLTHRLARKPDDR